MIYRNATTQQLTPVLWKHDKPICQIPNLAIHLTTLRGAFGWDDDQDLRPIIATTAVNKIFTAVNEKLGKSEDNKEDDGKYHGPYSTAIDKRHLDSLMTLMSSELGVAVENIVDFDLSFFDTTPASLVGLYDEFVSSPRLDHMMSSTCETRALLEIADFGSTKADVNMVLCYDHEECGSSSYQGAKGTFTMDVLERIYFKFSKSPGSAVGAINAKTKEMFKRCIKNSLLVSADMGHAVHPNYSYIHQSNHTPMLHGGVMFKISAD